MKMFNMDLTQRVVINSAKEIWLDSPASGVRRIPLEREDRESGRTTSIVEYLPGASFQKNFHPRGEEIFVIEGVFSNEDGDYPAGTYLRNPPGTSHAPFSKNGCRIFVKLNQMDSDDLKKVVLNTNLMEWRPGHGYLQVLPLHSFGTEGAALVKWPAGERFVKHTHFGGEEILVLKGEFIDEFERYPVGTWIRSPHLSNHFPFVEEETIIYVKTGHLLTKN